MTPILRFEKVPIHINSLPVALEGNLKYPGMQTWSFSCENLSLGYIYIMY